MELMVQGVERVVIIRIEQTEPYLRARVRLAPVPEDNNTEIEALQRAIVELASRAIELAQPNASAEFMQMLAANDDPLRLVYVIGVPPQPRPAQGAGAPGSTNAPGRLAAAAYPPARTNCRCSNSATRSIARRRVQ